MSSLDQIIKETDILSKEHSLYKPNLKRSVAGVLPEIIRHMNVEIGIGDNKVRNSDIEKKLVENFPSGIEKVILIIADGVGVNHIQQLGGLLADNINSKGTVASTMFPSMTSTVMSSISHGTYPAHHGVLGYNHYNEHVGDVWNSLAMRYRKDGQDQLILDDFSVDKLINGTSLIHIVGGKHNSFIAPAEIENPSLLDLVIPGMPITEYSGIEESLMKTAHSHATQTFTGMYYPFTDHFAHYEGPSSEEYVKAIQGLEIIIQKLLEIPTINDGNTAIVVTSDHGHSEIDHNISKWMTREEWDKHRKKGLTLSTSGRTNHLYAADSKIDEGRLLLEELLEGRGIIIDNKEAMKLAGSDYVREDFSGRMGSLVMLCEDGYMNEVPARVIFQGENKMKGQHGSLSINELFVPIGIFGSKL